MIISDIACTYAFIVITIFGCGLAVSCMNGKNLILKSWLGVPTVLLWLIALMGMPMGGYTI